MSTYSWTLPPLQRKPKKHSKWRWLPLSLGLSWGTAHEDLPTRLATNALVYWTCQRWMTCMYCYWFLTSFPTISCLRLCPNWLLCWNLCNSGSPVVCPYNHLKQRCESKLMLLTMKHPAGPVSQRGTRHVWFTTLTSHQRVVPSIDRFQRHHKRNNTYLRVTRHHKTGVELLIAIGISIFASFGVVWKTPDDSMISPSCARAHWLGQQGHLLVLQITFAGEGKGSPLMVRSSAAFS